MMFAQASSESLPAGWLKYAIIFVVSLLVLIAVVVGAVVSVLQYFQSKRAVGEAQAPQPFIVAMQKEFASKHEFDVHVAANVLEHNNLFSKIGGVDRGLREEDKQIRKEMADKFDAISRALGRIEGKISSDQS
jgi:hypothetical protein